MNTKDIYEVGDTVVLFREACGMLGKINFGKIEKYKDNLRIVWDRLGDNNEIVRSCEFNGSGRFNTGEVGYNVIDAEIVNYGFLSEKERFALAVKLAA